MEYFYLEVAAPPDKVKGELVTNLPVGCRGDLMYIKVKECKNCNHVQFFTLTLDEELEHVSKETN